MSAAAGDYARFVDIVAREYDIPPEKIGGNKVGRGDAKVVYGRRIVALCLRELGYSYPEIGEVLGRNHTTALRLVKGYYQGWDPKRTEKTLTAAQAEAKKIVAQHKPEPRVRSYAPKRPAPAWSVDPSDTERTAFERAKAAYFAAPPHERDQPWIDYCRYAFPNSWWAQACMPPGAGHAA